MQPRHGAARERELPSDLRIDKLGGFREPAFRESQRPGDLGAGEIQRFRDPGTLHRKAIFMDRRLVIAAEGEEAEEGGAHRACLARGVRPGCADFRQTARSGGFENLRFRRFQGQKFIEAAAFGAFPHGAGSIEQGAQIFKRAEGFEQNEAEALGLGGRVAGAGAARRVARAG